MVRVTSRPSILPSSSPAHPPSSLLSHLRSPLPLHPTQLLPVPLLPRRHPLRSAHLSFFPGTPPASLPHLRPPPSPPLDAMARVHTVLPPPYATARISLPPHLLPPICASHALQRGMHASGNPMSSLWIYDDEQGHEPDAIPSPSLARPAAVSPSPPASCVPPAPFLSAFVRAVIAGLVPRVWAYPCTPPTSPLCILYEYWYRALPLALAPRARIDPSVVCEPRKPRHRCALCSVALLWIPIMASASQFPAELVSFPAAVDVDTRTGRIFLSFSRPAPVPAHLTLPSASSSSPHSSEAPPPHPLRCPCPPRPPRPPRPPPPPSSSLHPVPPTDDRHFLRS
ncbi:hypothetical protein DFH08DRAFT_1084101 [Mycena albidolilacea]|uniref:Uncharacterized protein n=1 Tax=Mycena albidolilacea TaxID=1033008 RepID=A0AAD6ZPW3_9AGAR|nr:hypothetical protein DFH08DRAFT_1084101 [Mycena albidolilacea]